jgi:hypothetical protein
MSSYCLLYIFPPTKIIGGIIIYYLSCIFSNDKNHQWCNNLLFIMYFITNKNHRWCDQLICYVFSPSTKIIGGIIISDN